MPQPELNDEQMFFVFALMAIASRRDTLGIVTPPHPIEIAGIVVTEARALARAAIEGIEDIGKKSLK